MDTTFPKPVSLPGTMPMASGGQPISAVFHAEDGTSSTPALDISKSEASYNMLSSQGARSLINEYIQADVLDIPERFDISPTCADDASCTFRLEFHKDDAKARGKPQIMLFKVFAPLDPFFRTESEVATLTFLRTYTTIPVQTVYYFDSSSRNSLGLEWMLTSAPEGMPLDELFYNDGRRAVQWPTDRPTPTLSHAEYIRFIRPQVVEHCEELLRIMLNGTGSLYCNWATGKYSVGPLSEWTLSRNRLVVQDRELVEASRDADVKPLSGMIHGNLHAGNILVNPKTLKITCYLGLSSAMIAPIDMLPGTPLLEEGEI